MLYIVSTPIGNLKDITLRAIETLQQVDVIACEDTRKSLILLNNYNIAKPLISYHKFSEQKVSEQIIAMLQQGKSVALISDSGTPLVSDPGYVLVEKLKQQNLPYTVIPGPTAAISALVLSGLDTTKFAFMGFLPQKAKDKESLLKSVKNINMSLIFYVSPHSLVKDISIIAEHLGKRRARLVKEITKIHETVYSFVLGEELDINTKGEFVLVVEGQAEKPKQDFFKLDQQTVKNLFNSILASGVSESFALKQIANQYGVKKQEVYKVLKVK